MGGGGCAELCVTGRGSERRCWNLSVLPVLPPRCRAPSARMHLKVVGLFSHVPAFHACMDHLFMRTRTFKGLFRDPLMVFFVE